MGGEAAIFGALFSSFGRVELDSSYFTIRFKEIAKLSLIRAHDNIKQVVKNIFCVYQTTGNRKIEFILPKMIYHCI